MQLFKVIGILVVGMFIGYFLTLLFSDNQSTSEQINHPIEIKTDDEKHTELSLEKTVQSSEVVSLPCHQQDSQVSNNDTNTASEERLVIKTDAKLKQKYTRLEQELREYKQQVKSLKRQVGELDESNVTDEELLAFVPKNYEGLVVHSKGKTRDEIFDFHHQPEDLNEGFDLSQEILSFIVSHPYSYGVEVNSVICKKSNCELLINEKERPSWDRIYHEMNKQTWWEFTSMISSSTTDENGNIFIYYFMSK